MQDVVSAFIYGVILEFILLLSVHTFVMLAASIVESAKEWSGVCLSVCPVFSNVNVTVISQQCPEAAHVGSSRSVWRLI